MNVYVKAFETVCYVLTIAFLWLFCGHARAQVYSNKHAVIIGINKYPDAHWPDLTYARNDAKGIARLMKQLGFTVYTLVDEQATRLKIVSLLEDRLAPRLQKNDAILFFFAGHGETRTRNNGDFGYIVPYDGTGEEATYVSIEQLETLSRQMGKAKHQAFIMACCLGGYLGLRSSEIPANRQNYLHEVSMRVARQILTAGGKGQQVADGGPGGCSIFTGYLIKGIQEGLADLNRDSWITFSELVAYITPAATSRYQTPTFATLPGHELGEFLFRAPQQVFPYPEPLSSSGASSPLLRLRSEGTTLSSAQVKEMIVAKGFYEKWENRVGKGIRHQYRSITSDGKQLVIDNATGLMWQQSGSDKTKTFKDAQQYIVELNNQCFAGYSDWRLPTLEEAMSLMEPESKSGFLNIDPVFDRKQDQILTADKRSANTAWTVRFDFGDCTSSSFSCFVRAVRQTHSSPEASPPLLRFRSEGTTLSSAQAKEMIVAKGFYDKWENRGGKGIRHQYLSVTQDGKQLVIDGVTGLMWQKSGSDRRKTFKDAQQYILEMNNQRFAGYSDWRLPTLEEAMSLMEPERKNGFLNIDPVFDREQREIWTADTKSANTAWIVRFDSGDCSSSFTFSSVRAVRRGSRF